MEASEPVGAVELSLGADAPGARLRLPARESGVAVARQFIAGMGDVLHISPAAREDLKLAGTEACTNAVIHAYPNGTAGHVDVEVRGSDEDVLLIVRDHGCGLPSEESVAEEGGYGFELMDAVSDGVDVGEPPGGGTEVTLTFRAARRSGDELLDAVNSPVMRRVVAMIAAQAGFSMDRLSDAVLVAETLAAHAEHHSADAAVNVVIEQQQREVALRVGPLVPGGAERLLEASRLPAYGGVLEHLADAVENHPGDGEAGEYLEVRMRGRR